MPIAPTVSFFFRWNLNWTACVPIPVFSACSADLGSQHFDETSARTRFANAIRAGTLRVACFPSRRGFDHDGGAPITVPTTNVATEVKASPSLRLFKIGQIIRRLTG